MRMQVLVLASFLPFEAVQNPLPLMSNAGLKYLGKLDISLVKCASVYFVSTLGTSGVFFFLLNLLG